MVGVDVAVPRHEPRGCRLIQRDGFRDREDYYLTQSLWKGVWFSDRPNVAEHKEPAVLVLEIPEELVEEYEWIDEEGNWREFLIPAELANSYEPRRLLDWSNIEWA